MHEILQVLQEKYRKGGIPCAEEVKDDCGIPIERKENILKLKIKIKFYRDLAVAKPATSKKELEVKSAETFQRKQSRGNYEKSKTVAPKNLIPSRAKPKM